MDLKKGIRNDNQQLFAGTKICPINLICKKKKVHSFFMNHALFI